MALPCSSCSSSMPVTLTRSPTCLARFRRCRASTTSRFFEPLCRNPDFQLRAFGAPSPVAFFSRNVSSSCTRQPSIVTRSGAFAFASCGFAATFAFTTVVDTLAAAGRATDAGAWFFAGCADDVLAGSDVRAAIRMPVPRIQTTINPIAAVRLRMNCLTPPAKCIDFFEGIGPPLVDEEGSANAVPGAGGQKRQCLRGAGRDAGERALNFVIPLPDLLCGGPDGHGRFDTLLRKGSFTQSHADGVEDRVADRGKERHDA